jgi:hypothetical protein
MVMEENTTSMFRKPAEGGGIMSNFRVPLQCKMRSLLYRDVMQHKVIVIYQHFGRTIFSSSPRKFFLECLTYEDNIPEEQNLVEAVRFFEMMITVDQNTWCLNNDHILNVYCHENLK